MKRESSRERRVEGDGEGRGGRVAGGGEGGGVGDGAERWWRSRVAMEAWRAVTW